MPTSIDVSSAAVKSKGNRWSIPNLFKRVGTRLFAAAPAPARQSTEKPPAAVEVLPAVPNYDWGTVLTLVCFLFLFSHEKVAIIFLRNKHIKVHRVALDLA
jgi:hypothetical protein